jgi:hypothetical protein
MATNARKCQRELFRTTSMMFGIGNHPPIAIFSAMTLRVMLFTSVTTVQSFSGHN